MLPNQNCDIPEAVCCSAMYDIAAHLLDKVYFGLRDCYPEDPCGNSPLVAYVTMGSGDDGILDAVTVAMDSVSPSQGSANALAGRTPLLMRGVYVVRLRESGWPMVEEQGGEIIPPQPAMQNALARHAYSHGEKMYRILSSLIATREVFPPTLEQPGYAQLSALRPIPPLGGVIGFATTVTVDMPWGRG